MTKNFLNEDIYVIINLYVFIVSYLVFLLISINVNLINKTG